MKVSHKQNSISLLLFRNSLIISELAWTNLSSRFNPLIINQL